MLVTADRENTLQLLLSLSPPNETEGPRPAVQTFYILNPTEDQAQVFLGSSSLQRTSPLLEQLAHSSTFTPTRMTNKPVTCSAPLGHTSAHSCKVLD